jgi:hypothetical protein
MAARKEVHSGSGGGDPQHVGHALVKLSPLAAIQIHIAPRVVQGGDGEAGDVASD